MSFPFKFGKTRSYNSLETAEYGYKIEDLDNIRLERLNNLETMNVKESLDQLKIPDAIKDLPHFDGNKRTLFDFIANVEEILSLIKNLDGTPNGKIILRAVRNKIIGEANEVLNMYGTPLTWENIKTNLVTHYSDKRNETSLIRDLHNITQGSDSIEVYYSKIIDIYSTIMNNLKLNENDNNVVKSKQILYEDMCKDIFLSGIRGSLGQTIRAMRPTSLSEAFSYCIKEHNISYIKISIPPNFSLPNKKLHVNNSQHTQNRFRSNIPINIPSFHRGTSQPYNNYRPSFQPNIQSQYRPNPQPNSQPFTRQNFNQNYQNYRQPYIHKPLQKYPQPMDTSSGHSKKNQISTNQNFFRSVGQPKFRHEELFTLENNPNNDPQTYSSSSNQINQPEVDAELQYYDYNNQQFDSNNSQNYRSIPVQEQTEIDDQDFQQSALEPNSDI